VKKRIFILVLTYFLFCQILQAQTLENRLMSIGVSLFERKDIFISDLTRINANNTPLRDGKFISVENNLFGDVLGSLNLNVRFSPNKFIKKEYRKYADAAKLTISFGFVNNIILPLAKNIDLPGTAALSDAKYTGMNFGIVVSRAYKQGEYFVGFTYSDVLIDVRFETGISFDDVSVDNVNISESPVSLDFGVLYKLTKNREIVVAINYFPRWYKVNAIVSCNYRFVDLGLMFAIGEPIFIYPFARVDVRF